MLTGVRACGRFVSFRKRVQNHYTSQRTHQLLESPFTEEPEEVYVPSLLFHNWEFRMEMFLCPHSPLVGFISSNCLFHALRREDVTKAVMFPSGGTTIFSTIK